MREERQPCAEEFPATHAAPPSSWRECTAPALLQCGLRTVTTFRSAQRGKGEEKSNFKVENPDGHGLSSRSRSNPQ